jgi:hypothetical protein
VSAHRLIASSPPYIANANSGSRRFFFQPCHLVPDTDITTVYCVLAPVTNVERNSTGSMALGTAETLLYPLLPIAINWMIRLNARRLSLCPKTLFQHQVRVIFLGLINHLTYNYLYPLCLSRSPARKSYRLFESRNRSFRNP